MCEGFELKGIFSTKDEACSCVGVTIRPSGAGRFTVADLTNDVHGRGAGRIRVFDDGRGGQVFNFKTNACALWFADYGRTMSKAERTALQRQAEESRRKAENEARRRAESAAGLSMAIMRAARPVIEHPYLLRKRVLPDAGFDVLSAGEINAVIRSWSPELRSYSLYSHKVGAPMSGDVLCIPLMAFMRSALTLTSVQFIDGFGSKSFLTGARTKNAYWMPSCLRRDVRAPHMAPRLIGIAEGVATALSVTQVKGFPVVAAMSCGNLEATARAMRTIFPRSELIVLGDVGNGEKQAREAAQNVGARLAFPVFDKALTARFRAITGTDSTPTDFNDYYIAKEAL